MKKFLLVLLAGVVAQSYGQKQVAQVQQIWTAYFNQTRFSDKWGLWADFHLRTKDDYTSDLSSGIARLGLTYYLNDNTKLTVGYGYINHFPGDTHADISRPEHRPWQQIQWHTKYNKLRLAQYVRLEERYRRKVKDNDELAPGHDFNYRVRYNFLAMVPFSRNAFAPRTLSFVFNDEAHVNFGKEIVYNTFDQNRLFLGVAYHVNPHDNVQLGYLNVFQQLPAGNRYRNIDAIRLFYFHTLDARRKNSQ
jgi:hypothetical protein